MKIGPESVLLNLIYPILPPEPAGSKFRHKIKAGEDLTGANASPIIASTEALRLNF